MKLSTRSRYGLRTMANLAKSHASGPVSLAQIAEEEDVSLAYLEQLAKQLREHGLVVSTRGAHGGYQLARPADKITVGDVVRAMEGSIAPVECISEKAAKGICDRESICTTKAMWMRLRDSITTALDSTTLADLISNN